MGDIHSAQYQRDRAAKRKEWRTQKRVCHLCGQPIDYDLPATDPEHFQLDHIKSRRTHPHLENDPLNWAPSHASCNKRKHTGPGTPGVGSTSENW